MVNEDFNSEKEFYNKIGKTIGWNFANIKCETIDKNAKKLKEQRYSYNA